METCERFDVEFLPEWEETGRLASEHVRSCPECGARYASYQVIAKALRSSDAPELRADWQQGVLERIAAAHPATSSAQVSVEQAVQHSQIRALRPASLRRVAFVGAPLLAAAAALLLFVSKPAQVAPLPGYGAALEGGQRTFRDVSAPQSFQPGSPLELLLRPEHAVQGEIGARVFVQGATLSELPIQQTQLAKGVLRIKAVTPRAPSADQRQITLLIVVARPELLVGEAASLATQTIDGGSDWRRIRVAVNIAH